MSIKNSLSLLTPKQWPTWLAIGILWIITRFPYTWQLNIGHYLGQTVYYLAPRRRQIAEINIRHCFPQLSSAQQQKLLKQHFTSLGIGLLDMLNAWWTSDARLAGLAEIEGLEHLHAALARGKGVILLSAHFTSLEIGARFLTQQLTIHVTYRPHENPVIELFMKRSRESHAEKAIPRDAIRTMLRSLKQNKPLWFATDQNFGHKHSVFADFFGIPAATNTATSRLAQISQAAVIPFFTQRLPQGRGYRVILQPMLTAFPSADPQADAQRINRLIENQIKQAPEQYLWVHRRFKDRPAGQKSFY